MKSGFQLTFNRKILLIASFLLMGIIRAALLMLPFRCIATCMGKERFDSPAFISRQQSNKAIIISQVIAIASKHTPWKSECLVQALTAQVFLKIFKIPNTLYLGISKDDLNSLQAHAWLRCGELIITGAQVRNEFKEINKFSNCY